MTKDYRDGYEAAIQKAAEWLEKHTEQRTEILRGEAVADYVATDKYETKDEFLERFKKALL